MTVAGWGVAAVLVGAEDATDRDDAVVSSASATRSPASMILQNHQSWSVQLLTVWRPSTG